MPSAAFSHWVTVTGPPDLVWAGIQQPASWVGVGPIDRVYDAAVAADGGLQGYRWEAEVAGRRWKGTARTVEATPGSSMQMELDSPQLQITLAAHLRPDGADTRLEIRIGVASKGMLATLFWGLVEQAIRGSLPSQVEAFGRRLAR